MRRHDGRDGVQLPIFLVQSSSVSSLDQSTSPLVAQRSLQNVLTSRRVSWFGCSTLSWDFRRHQNLWHRDQVSLILIQCSHNCALPSLSFHRFAEIWYEVFIWCLFSSIGIYVCAALVAFLTLRKHKFGRFYSLMILLMGFFLPLTLGVVSSASIAFVYKTSR